MFSPQKNLHEVMTGLISLMQSFLHHIPILDIILYIINIYSFINHTLIKLALKYHKVVSKTSPGFKLSLTKFYRVHEKAEFFSSSSLGLVN
jgi:hypothetical protein